MDPRSEHVIRAAHAAGAQSVHRDGVVLVTFRKMDRWCREIGYLEARFDERVSLLEYRQSSCVEGRRWGVAISSWVSRVGASMPRFAASQVRSQPRDCMLN